VRFAADSIEVSSIAVFVAVITEAKVVKGSEPFGITVDPDGHPWYTMMSANKIAEVQLR
jgi:streptogramin lyase